MRFGPLAARRFRPPAPVSGGAEGNAGPFLPAPASAITTLTLNAAASGTKPWAAGHVFAEGDLPAGQALSGIQTTVKSTWPDGSTRVAVLASVTAMAGA